MCVFGAEKTNWMIALSIASFIQVIGSIVSIRSAIYKNRSMKIFNSFRATVDVRTYCTLSSFQITWSIILFLCMILLNSINLYKIYIGDEFINFQFSQDSISDCQGVISNSNLYWFTSNVYIEWLAIGAVNQSWNIILIFLCFELVVLLFTI